MLGAEVSPGEQDSDYTIDIDELNEHLKLFLK
jgi:hypothetical protein